MKKSRFRISRGARRSNRRSRLPSTTSSSTDRRARFVGKLHISPAVNAAWEDRDATRARRVGRGSPRRSNPRGDGGALTTVSAAIAHAAASVSAAAITPVHFATHFYSRPHVASKKFSSNRRSSFGRFSASTPIGLGRALGPRRAFFAHSLQFACTAIQCW